MALTITPGYTFSNGETMTTTHLNSLGTPALTAPADTLVGATATGSVTTITCTSAGRAILDDADASAQRTTLGLGSGATATISAYGLTLVDDASASAARTTLGLGTVATQDASSIDLTGGKVAVPWYAASPTTLTYAATATVDFSSTAATMQTITLTGNLTLNTSNLAAGRVKALRLVGDSSDRTLTFPGWTFMGATPTTLVANTTARLTLESWGTSDTSVVAMYTNSA